MAKKRAEGKAAPSKAVVAETAEAKRRKGSSRLLEDLFGDDPDFLESMAHPPVEKPASLTDEQLARVAESLPMLNRMAAVIGREFATDDEPRPPPARRWNLEARQVAFCERMRPLVDRLARAHVRSLMTWEARRIEPEELLRVARQALITFVDAQRDKALANEASCWRFVDEQITAFVTQEASFTLISKAADRLSGDFTAWEAAAPDEPPGWQAYDDAAWAHAAAFVVGAAGASELLKGERLLHAADAMKSLHPLLKPLWGALSADEQSLLGSRIRGIPLKMIAERRGASEGEIGRRVHAALRRLGPVLRRHVQGSGRPPPVGVS